MGIEHVSPDTDTNKILEIIERDAAVVIDNVLSSKDLDDIKNELKTHDLELRIQDLESKFAEDFNQNTFDEINRLKKEQNIN